ncbi:MAG: aminoacyl-tRNA hydrolase [Calditrichia bacterium]|nr:aminoacyl-tRNA hydrolase [Calditrichia bacterium]
MRDNNIKISNKISIPFSEIEITAIRSQGPGGQHVNKVSTAIQLRFHIKDSSLPEFCIERLLNLNDNRITRRGDIVIKSQEYKSQTKNREAAIERLKQLIQSVLITRKKRKPTKPTASSREKRLDRKTQKGKIKTLRKKIKSWD